MADERRTSKPFAVGDSATTAHLKGALTGARERDAIKRVEMELAAKRAVPSAKKEPRKG